MSEGVLIRLGALRARLAELLVAMEGDARSRALRDLLYAGEPFISEAFPGEQMNAPGLRAYNRWLAAMNDARTALADRDELAREAIAVIGRIRELEASGEADV